MTSKALVVGSGAIGLRTALELLRKNVSVILRSAQHPLHPSTCSMGSGGLWMPYKCPDPRVNKWAKETLDELLDIHSSPDNAKDNLVEIVPTIFLSRTHQGPKLDDYKDFKADDYHSVVSKGNLKSSLPEWTQDPRICFQHLTIEMLAWQNQVLKLRIPSIESIKDAGYKHGWLFRPPIVNAPRMLTKMLDEVLSHPLTHDVNVEMDQGGYHSLEDILDDARALGCDAVFNCTGLGSSKLCSDDLLVPGRGILFHYDRNCARHGFDEANMKYDAAILTEDGPWGSPIDPIYIIPRGDVFVVGGSYHEGAAGTDITETEKKRLTENAALMGIDTSLSSPTLEWVGFRPARPTIRLEKQNMHGVQVVHSYGHGGSGWTAYVGAAKNSVAMLDS